MNLQSNTTIIKNKVGLLNLAEELGNISRACKLMGFSRDTFYRYQKAVDEGGVEDLIDKTRRKPNFKNIYQDVNNFMYLRNRNGRSPKDVK